MHRSNHSCVPLGVATEDLQHHCQDGMFDDELRSHLQTPLLPVRAGGQKRQSSISSMPMAASSQMTGLLPATPRSTFMPTASCTP